MNKKRIEVIKKNINRDRRLTRKKQYVITTEVHVRRGARLMIDDGVTILIENGKKTGQKIGRAALVFDQGSILIAKNFQIRACDKNYIPVKCSDNGGLWFLGNHRTAKKDKIKVEYKRRLSSSFFKARSITTHYLGRLDPIKRQSRTKEIEDDIDGISLLGVGPNEWLISKIRSNYSADDGLDLTNSHVSMRDINIRTPIEDGINLSSSYLEIQKSLKIDVKKNKYKDRDLFDFEVDEGPSIIILQAKSKLFLHGVFGDQIQVVFEGLPKPNTKNNNEDEYRIDRKINKAIVLYSANED